MNLETKAWTANMQLGQNQLESLDWMKQVRDAVLIQQQDIQLFQDHLGRTSGMQYSASLMYWPVCRRK